MPDTHKENDAELLTLLDSHAGVGLWDAVLHNGDPMHAESKWRWSAVFRSLLGFNTVSEFPDVVSPGQTAFILRMPTPHSKRFQVA